MIRRIVLVHTVGVYAGLWRICGTEDQLAHAAGETDLPTFVEGVDFIDHLGNANLVGVKAHYALYHETFTASPVLSPDQV